jgi:hypothetical protein
VIVVKALEFPSNIADLKSIIGFFSYYRKFIPFFTRIAALLEKLKIIRLVEALFKGQKRLNFTVLITIPLPPPKLVIKDAINKSKKIKRIKRK